MSSKAESKEVEEETIHWKAGQKFPTPSPGNGDRVFYETLYQQKPSSEMAQEWVLTYGILSHADAQKLFDKVNKRKNGPSSSSSSAAASKTMKSPERKPTTTSSRKGKVVIEEDEGDDDGAVWESKGRTGV